MAGTAEKNVGRSVSTDFQNVRWSNLGSSMEEAPTANGATTLMMIAFTWNDREH